MRVTKFGVVVLGLGVSVPAIASGAMEIGYLGLRGSYVSAENQGTTSTLLDDDRSFSNGWGASGFVGFIVDDALRAEIEGGYRINTIDSAKIIRNVNDNTTEGSTFAADGQVDMGLAMLNMYYDIHIDDLPVLPWVGVGIGGAYVNYQINYDYDGVGGFDPVSAKDSDWQFAYQLMAGVTIPVAETMSMSVSYRYFATEDLAFVDSIGSEFQTQLSNQSIDVGLQYHL